MTNFELITQSNKDQLAEFFAKMTQCKHCFLYSKCFECKNAGCKKVFKQWLEQEAKK